MTRSGNAQPLRLLETRDEGLQTALSKFYEMRLTRIWRYKNKKPNFALKSFFVFTLDPLEGHQTSYCHPNGMEIHPLGPPLSVPLLLLGGVYCLRCFIQKA